MPVTTWPAFWAYLADAEWFYVFYLQDFFIFIVASVFLHFDISLSHDGISFSKIAIDLSQKLVFLLLYSFFPSKQRHRFAQVGKLLINKQNFHTFRLRQSKNRAQSGAFVRLIKLDKVGARTGLQIIKPV